MPFLSLSFAVLLTVAVITFHVVPLRARRHYLLALSYAFYASWGLRYVPLLAAATALAWFVGPRLAQGEDDIEASPAAQAWLIFALVAFLGALFSFKYLPTSLGVSGFIAPLGISYYTFRLVSYLVDIYWRRQAPERDFVTFALYISFFPQIVSGPIQRPHDFMLTVSRPQPVSAAFLTSGMRLILFGLFKKLIVANRLEYLVATVFDSPHGVSGAAFLVGAYAFAIQLYADFSGLTDIALGIGRLFGIEGPPNFDNPFYAPNIQAFWQRWHISLTSWLGDYLFSPLRMALRNAGQLGLVCALAIDMLAVGLWHGARWTFIVFGGVNAVYMVVSALTLRRRNKIFKRLPLVARIRPVVGAVITFHLIVVALVLFRASTLDDALFICRHLAPSRVPGWGLTGIGLNVFGAPGLAALIAMEVIHVTRKRGTLQRLLDWSPAWLRWSAYYAAVGMVAVFGQIGVQSFIYARF